MNKFWNMSSNMLDDSILNMYVYGDIVTDSHWLCGSEDDVVTRSFIKDLNNHPEAKQINVYINSGGGEVFAAVAMAQQLKKHKASVHTYVEGIAASAATIIAMAGDVRHMTRSGLFMIHLPSSQVSGNKHQMAKGVEVLEKVEEIIRLTYEDKSNLSAEELTDMIDHETWLTADEAYRYGFIDSIEEEPDRIDDLIKDVQNDMVSMHGVNINVAAYAQPELFRAKLTEIQNTLNKGGKEMDFQALLNSMPVDKRSAIESEIKAQVEKTSATLTEQVTNLTEQVTSLTTSVEDAQSELVQTRASLQEADERVASLTKGAEDSDTTFLDSLPAEAKQAVLDSRKIAKEAQDALAVIQKDKEYATFCDKVKAYDNLPLQEEHIKALFNIQNNNVEDFATIEKLFNSANTAMAEQFEQTGQDGEDLGAPVTAYDEIEKMITAKREADTTLDYNEAMQSVISENPDLYNRYRSEQ